VREQSGTVTLRTQACPGSRRAGCMAQGRTTAIGDWNDGLGSLAFKYLHWRTIDLSARTKPTIGQAALNALGEAPGVTVAADTALTAARRALSLLSWPYSGGRYSANWPTTSPVATSIGSDACRRLAEARSLRPRWVNERDLGPREVSYDRDTTSTRIDGWISCVNRAVL